MLLSSSVQPGQQLEVRHYFNIVGATICDNLSTGKMTVARAKKRGMSGDRRRHNRIILRIIRND